MYSITITSLLFICAVLFYHCCIWCDKYINCTSQYKHLCQITDPSHHPTLPLIIFLSHISVVIYTTRNWWTRDCTRLQYHVGGFTRHSGQTQSSASNNFIDLSYNSILPLFCLPGAFLWNYHLCWLHVNGHYVIAAGHVSSWSVCFVGWSSAFLYAIHKKDGMFCVTKKAHLCTMKENKRVDDSLGWVCSVAW